MQDQKETGPGGAGCFVRIYWILFGHAILWLLLANIVARQPKSPFAYDVVYWVIVASLGAARYVDIRYLNGRTAYSDNPATLKHWLRYTALVVIAYLGLWVAAHGLGRFSN